jgi:hypothetical protein
MIQSIHKGVEIEMEAHQLPHGMWRCDYTLITHPGRTRAFHQGGEEFATMDLAYERTLEEARGAIDKEVKGQPEENSENPPRQVRI